VGSEENVVALVSDENDDLETTSNEEARSRCKALTKKGRRCKNPSLADSEYCRVHQAKELAQQANTEPTLPKEEGDVAKEQQRHPTRHEWDARAYFTVSFEVGTAEYNRGKWQTRVYFEESSKGVKEETDEIAGVQTAPWVKWILERAKSQRVPVETVLLKTEIAAQLVPTEAEVVTPSAPMTPNGVQLKILDIQVSKTEPSAGGREKTLTAEVRFQLSGADARPLAAEGNPLWIHFHTVDLETGAANLVASEQCQLQPDISEYTSQRTFPIPDLGHYRLQSMVVLLPPGRLMAFREGPTFRVVP
jgi:hypothetical protein